MELLTNTKFLEAVCYVIAAVALYFYPDSAVTSVSLMALVLSGLRLLGIKQQQDMIKMSTEIKMTAKTTKAKKAKKVK